MRKAGTFLFLILVMNSSHYLAAQDSAATDQKGASASMHEGATKDDEHYYKLLFRVVTTGGDGSSSSSRTYSQLITADHTGRNGRPSEIRTGDKIPVVTGSSGADNVNTQFQYLDIGTEIDILNATDNGGELQAFVTAKVSSVATVKPADQNPALGHQPVIRECKWDSKVTVQIGKPTIIFSSDNPSDKGKTELELTATPIR